MNHKTYLAFLRCAQKKTRRAHEAEDLLQTALLAAIEAGRSDFSLSENRRWLIGTITKRAAFDARTALRRQVRERQFEPPTPATQSTPPLQEFIKALPPSLRGTALLCLTGHTRAEILYLQRLSNAALRQRISQIRRRWRALNGPSFETTPGLQCLLPYGAMRRALHRPLRQLHADLASHDADGHLFVLGTAHKTRACGNLEMQPMNKE